MLNFKSLFLAILTLPIFWASQGLAQSFSAGDKIFKKKDFMITLGYSIPSALRVYINREEADADLKVNGYGPFFLKLDYFLFKNFTVGFTGMYNFSDVHWLQNAQDQNGNTNLYRHGLDVKEASISLRLNYYFVNREKWSMYGGGGMGVGYINLASYTRAPKTTWWIDHTFPMPYNFETTVGAKYALDEHVSIYAEGGIGQSWWIYKYYYIPAAILQAGLSFKF